MKELVYTQDTRGLVKTPTRNYSNPNYFSHVRPGYDRVVIVGNYPKIVRAYEDVGVEVQVVDDANQIKPEEFEPVLEELSDEEVLALPWDQLIAYTKGRTQVRPTSKAQAYELLGVSVDDDDDDDEDDEDADEEN